MIIIVFFTLATPVQAAWFGLFERTIEDRTLAAQIDLSDSILVGSDGVATRSPEPTPISTKIPTVQGTTVVAAALPGSKRIAPAPLPSWVLCSCVNFVKWITRRTDESWGNARAMKPTTQIPRAGVFVLTSEGEGHVAYVTSVASSSITVVEANYKHCKQSERVLPIDSPVIRGYLEKN